jgi:RNase P subunit RPR2
MAMKNDDILEMRICPRCHKPYSGRPALSRVDNETLICPDCGTREALESIGVESEEQEQILETIHRSMQS